MQEENYTQVNFVARDGYLLDKVFEIINRDPSVKSRYVYLNRAMKHIMDNSTNLTVHQK